MDYPRIGEALVRGERHRLSAAEPELIIGDLNGPVGVASPRSWVARLRVILES
jgi:hypothetical protein